MTARRILLVLLFAVACGAPSTRGRDGAAAATDTSRTTALFAHVPASTPYFIGSFEAIPPAYFAKLGDIMAPAIAQVYDETLAEGDTESVRFFDAIRAELAGKWTRSGLQSLGFSTTPRFAIYGLGGVFVARLEIADERTLLATARRIAKRAQLQFSDGEQRAGRRFWRTEEDGRAYLVALADRQLVVAFGDAPAVERALSAILGIDKPKANLGDGRLLAALAKRHQLGPHIIGYLDTKLTVDLVLANNRGKLAGTCAQELYTLASQFPRLVAGFRDLTVPRTTFAMVVEMAPDLAAQLTAIRTPLPGLRELLAGKPMFAFAAAADSLGVVGVASRVLARVEQLAKQCPHDEELAKAGKTAADWIPKLDPLSPTMPKLALSLGGAAVRVDTLKLDGGPLPSELEAVAVVASTHTKELFELVQQQLPWFAGLSSQPDARLQRVDIGFGDFHVGVGTKLIAAAAGPRGKEVAERVLVAAPDAPAPLLSFNYDYGQLLALKGERADTQDDPAKAAEWALDGMIAEHFGRAYGAIDVTSTGLELWMTYEMK